MSVVAILHSLGILALMAVGISMLQPSRLGDAPGRRRSLVMGAVFGTTIAVVMVDPIVILPGVAIDPRGGPAMLAGIYGGPVAAVVAAAIGGAMRWWIGGAGAVGGVVGLAIYAAVGTAAWYRLRGGRKRPTLTWLLGLAILGTVCALPSAFAFPDWRTGLQLLSKAWWMVLAGNVTGVLVLGFLLEQDWRRRMLEYDLRLTEAQTRAATEAKTRFLASMSHEIRTPMNAVVGFVDLLRDSNLDSFQRRCTDQIREAAQGLLRIIDDMLDFAKIDSGHVALEPQPVDVAELVEGCRELLMPQFEAKGIACTLDLTERLPAFEVDPQRLRQVLLNLLGNAVKFTDSGRVAVTARYAADPGRGHGELTIIVADTGIGMTVAERDRLFSPFAQGDHIGRGGTGLGLVISRMLVQAMGGDLALESGQGHGTVVTVRMPVREAPAAAAMHPDSAPRPMPGRHALRVLVAEDVALNAEMLQATLEQSEHVVQVVSDGQQAVDAARDARFDVILMDVQMPVMDGLAATRAIRAIGGPAAAVPITALTAYASRDDLKACLDAGMNDFLTKPLERAKLQEILERWGGGDQAGPAAGIPAAAATKPAVPEGDPGGAVGDENVERVGELLARLGEVDRDDRDAIRSMAHSLVSAADSLGFQALAERSRRLVTASPRSNAEALGALIEDAADAGRRALLAARRPGDGDRR